MMIFYLILLCLALLIYLGLLLIFIVQIYEAFQKDAPFVPIPYKVRKEILDNLDLHPNSVFYDLGCGDGRILVDVAKKFPNLENSVKLIGIEMALVPYCLAKWRTKKYKNIEIKKQNIFKTNLSDATDIFYYLMPKALDKLLEKLKKECRPGTKVMACDFAFKNLEPVKIIQIETSKTKRGQNLFIYSL